MNFFVLAAFLLPFAASAGNLDALKSLPVQSGGRVKPYDTFARETLRLIYGKDAFNGKPAVEVVTTWFLIPEHWNTIPIIQLRRTALKEALKVDVKKDYFTLQE